MKMFVHSQEFKKMNIGLTLDEGLASPTDEVPVYYGERNVYWVKFKIAGEYQKLHMFLNSCCMGKAEECNLKEILGTARGSSRTLRQRRHST